MNDHNKILFTMNDHNKLAYAHMYPSPLFINHSYLYSFYQVLCLLVARLTDETIHLFWQQYLDHFISNLIKCTKFFEVMNVVILMFCNFEDFTFRFVIREPVNILGRVK